MPPESLAAPTAPEASTDWLRHLAVEGPIGVGKTSLARRLAASLGSDILLEDADANPFLGAFYDNPRAAALPAQLFFLLQRAEQLEQLKQPDMFAPVRVADFLMEKDRLFAELTLNSDELRLYDKIWSALAVELPVPDLVVYLQAPVPVLKRRIAQRGIEQEQDMPDAYLQRLSDAYVHFFRHYRAAPVLTVNAAELDFVNDDNAYRALLECIVQPPGERRYFGPRPT